MYKAIETCRMCGSSELESIFSLGMQSMTGVFPLKEHADALNQAPLELVQCKGECGLLQLRHSCDLNEMYGETYGYHSNLNQQMVAHLENRIEKALSVVAVGAGDCVLDIGSNDGTSLGFYLKKCKEVPRMIGVDPCIPKFRSYYDPSVELIDDFFPTRRIWDKVEPGGVKVVTSIAMFYDLENPLEFAEAIERLLADDGIWIFEQSYLSTMLTSNAYDTICHEHLEYYGLKQIKWLLDQVGLKILSVELNDVNGGSFCVTAAKQKASIKEDQALVNDLLQKEEAAIGEQLEAFTNATFKHKEELPALLKDLKEKGKTVMGYGASTKGNVVLQHCGIDSDLLSGIAEVNPDKFGCVTPGTQIPILDEAKVMQAPPDYFLVLPWHFKEGILKRNKSYLNGGGSFIFPLPELHIVGEGA